MHRQHKYAGEIRRDDVIYWMRRSWLVVVVDDDEQSDLNIALTCKPMGRTTPMVMEARLVFSKCERLAV